MDGCRGRTKPPRVRGHAFQLTAEDAREAPDVVTSMFSFMILSRFFYCMLMIVYLLGTFLVNSLPDLVLFD